LPLSLWSKLFRTNSSTGREHSNIPDRDDVIDNDLDVVNVIAHPAESIEGMGAVLLTLAARYLINSERKLSGKRSRATSTLLGAGDPIGIALKEFLLTGNKSFG
jgi:hypothetical protein